MTERTKARLNLALMVLYVGGCIVLLSGCETVPVMDEDGNPTGKTTWVWSWGKAAETVQTAVPFIPPPWNTLVVGVAGVVSHLDRKKKETS